MPVAPWLQAADPAAEWARGAQLGSQIAGERARLQMERERMQIETQARQQTLDRQQQYRQAQLATANARLQAEIGLREQRLAQIQAVNAQRTQAAATKWAAQQSYARDIQAGMTHEQALYRNPALLTPQAIVDAQKTDEDLGKGQLDIQREREDIANRRLLAQEAKKDKGISVAYTPKDNPDYKASGSLPDMQAQFGTNLPPEFQDRPENYPPADAATFAARNPFRSGNDGAAPASNAPFAEGAVIRSKKDGKTYKVVNGQPVAQDDGDTAAQ